MSRRFEMRLSDDLWGRIEGARGDLPRAAWVRRALEKALGDDESASRTRAKPPASASPRASKKPPVGELPKIAPRHWA